ncbi:hypothetical protein Actkin_05583 [Actinokineospora sp. UTMC 2448]|nr:hypothetical protein Actkin_05583 [Actinokineospora sp. UTMC 2448]
MVEQDSDRHRELVPVDRFQWEKIVRRIRGMSDPDARLAFLLPSYGNRDGTSIRPGHPELMAATGWSQSKLVRVFRSLRERYGLLQEVAHGGGKGSGARASEFRLTLPADLYDRFDVRDPGNPTPPTPVTQMTGDRPGSSVDKPRTQVVQDDLSSDGGTAELRSSGGQPDRNSGHLRLNSGHPGDHPPSRPTRDDQGFGPVPAQPQTARATNRPQPHPPAVYRNTERQVDALAAARRAAFERQAAIQACVLCDDRGYVLPAGRALCHHDPDAATRYRRGRSAAQAALDAIARRRRSPCPDDGDGQPASSDASASRDGQASGRTSPPTTTPSDGPVRNPTADAAPPLASAASPEAADAPSSPTSTTPASAPSAAADTTPLEADCPWPTPRTPDQTRLLALAASP